MKINEPKPYLKGFSGSLVVKNPPAKQETGLTPGGQKDPLEKEMQPTPVFLLGKFHGQRSLAATGHGIAKSQTRLHSYAAAAANHI